MKHRRYRMDDEVFDSGRRLSPDDGVDDDAVAQPILARPWSGEAVLVVTAPEVHHPNPELRDMYTVVANYGGCAVVVHRRAAARAVAAALEALAEIVRKVNP